MAYIALEDEQVNEPEIVWAGVVRSGDSVVRLDVRDKVGIWICCLIDPGFFTLNHSDIPLLTSSNPCQSWYVPFR